MSCLICDGDTLTRIIGAVPILARATAIVSDLFMLIITWMNTAYAWRTSLPSAMRSRLKLSTLLLRDGELTLVSYE